MNGQINQTKGNGVVVHTYTAPDDGWLVNSHIIELKTQLLLVDAQFKTSYAEEVSEFAKSLGKPLTRVYISHYHPDHHNGTAAFSAPVYELAQVSQRLKDFNELTKSHIPTTDHFVEEGSETIDGVHFQFVRLHGAETEDALIIALPDSSILITQDLLYHGAHVFIGEQSFESWRRNIAKFRHLGYPQILPGHGLPGGDELFDKMVNYLQVAEEALAYAADLAQYKELMIKAFPDHGVQVLIDLQAPFLFPKK